MYPLGLRDRKQEVLDAFAKDPEEAFQLVTTFLRLDSKWANSAEFVQLVLGPFGDWVTNVKWKQ